MDTDLPEGWSLAGTERAYDTRWVKVRKDALRDPAGKIHDWYVVERDDAAVVFCVTADGKILVNRQFKFGARAWVVEPPAGYVDPGETPEQAARRELEEETGYVCGEVTPLVPVPQIMSPTGERSRIFLFYADGATPTGRVHREEGEVIETSAVTPEELDRMLTDGTVNTMVSTAVFALGLARLRRTA